VTTQLKGTDIMNTINIDIHAPVIPNRKMQIAIAEEIADVLKCECKVRFHNERGNAFEISVYNDDFQEKPVLQEKVMKLFFTFFYQNKVNPHAKPQ